MDQRLKERLFGAFIIISLFVIFLPMVLQEPVQETFIEQVPKPEPKLELKEAWMEPPQELIAWQQQVKEQQDAMQQEAAWTVQLATFANPENAEKLAKSLKNKGYQAYLEQVPGQTSQLTWVLVGPEADKSVALKLQASLESTFKLKGSMIVPYQPKS